MSFSELTPEEWGRPNPPAEPVKPEGQPRGEARFPVPHASQFAGMLNWANRAYMHLFDEAKLHNRENAERIRLDPVIDSSMRLLTEAVTLITHHVEPEDDEDPIQVEWASKFEKVTKYMPGWLFAKHWLADEGAFVGRAGAKVRYQWKPRREKNWMLPTGFQPVAGDKLHIKWDGRIGIYVQSGFTGPTEFGAESRAYVLTPEDREQFICHQFEPSDASFWKPQKAGAIGGLGLRDKLYWLWALKQRVWAMSMDFLQWFAKGLLIVYFRGHNDEHRRQMQEYLEAQDGNSALFLPWWASEDGFKPVEMFQPSMANAQFLQTLVTDYFDMLIRQVILGQTLTSGTAPTGLGSGVAAAHQGTFENKVKYHSMGLDETLTRDLLGPLYRANAPGVPPGRWVSDIDDPNIQQMIDNARAIYEMGGAVPEEPLLEAGGLPQVKPGDTVLTQMQPMQPAATDAVPNNVPVVQASPAQLARLVRLARNGDSRAKTLLSSGRVRCRQVTPPTLPGASGSARR